MMVPLPVGSLKGDSGEGREKSDEKTISYTYTLCGKQADMAGLAVGFWLMFAMLGGDEDSVGFSTLQYLIANFFRVDRHASAGGSTEGLELIERLDEPTLVLFLRF